MSLAEKKCQPCHGGTTVLSRAQLEPLLAELNSWTVAEDKKLRKQISTKTFAESLRLANLIGAEAEAQQHHPDLLVRWGELHVELWTHAIDGLSEADFILAARIDKILNAQAQ